MLGTGGRKVLSMGGEGPSGSRGSRDLRGEAGAPSQLPLCLGGSHVLLGDRGTVLYL